VMTDDWPATLAIRAVTHSDIDCVASTGEGELAPIGYYMSPGCGRDPGGGCDSRVGTEVFLTLLRRVNPEH